MPLELGLAYIVYLKKVVITPETFSTILLVGSVVKVIKKNRASVKELDDDLSTQKSAQLEVKQGPIQQSQDETELEEPLQALRQKPRYLFMF